jgi:putative SOS response-associated peptidase YedK
MCFSVNVNIIKEEMEERYGVTFPDKYRYEPSYYYHAFSLPSIPAICSDNPGTIRVLKWGLIPSWTKTAAEAEKIRFKTFNARSESIDIKPSFSGSFKMQRCIIPVRGFYEWQHRGNEKIPWYIFSPADQIITIAGIFSEWSASSAGEKISTFSIITTEANEFMAGVHNSKKRMPVILDRKAEKRWIDLSISPGEARSMLGPCPSDYLTGHSIGPLINDRRANRNTPDIILPYQYYIDNGSGTLL